MRPYCADESVTLLHGDCLDLMREMPDASVDAVVTDPPYGLEFMGKEWDSFKPASSRGAGAQFALGSVGGYAGKPMPRHGKRWSQRRCVDCGHVDGGAAPCRCASPTWATTTEPGTPRFASTFQDWCLLWTTEAFRVLKPGGHLLAFGGARTWHRLTCAVEDAGFEVRDSIAWLYGSGFPKSLNLTGDRQGWGTALKPAFEPIVVARKPLIGTVATNVLEHGTGALNIDACRVGMTQADAAAINAKHAGMDAETYERPAGVSLNLSVNPMPLKPAQAHDGGRWPTNVLLDGDQADELDKQSGTTASRIGKPRGAAPGDGWGMTATGAEYDDQGGTSRFFPRFTWTDDDRAWQDRVDNLPTFRYEAKAPTSERPRDGETAHPTVKPLDLMRWLVRLVTPPAGTVLEPFAGSGTTAEACVIEGFRCIAIEREAAYLPLIVARLGKPIQPDLFGGAA